MFPQSKRLRFVSFAFILLASMACVPKAHAGDAVATDAVTGQWAAVYSSDPKHMLTSIEAEDMADEKCMKAGVKSPEASYRSDRTGYVAVARGFDPVRKIYLFQIEEAYSQKKADELVLYSLPSKTKIKYTIVQRYHTYGEEGEDD